VRSLPAKEAEQAVILMRRFSEAIMIIFKLLHLLAFPNCKMSKFCLLSELTHVSVHCARACRIERQA
jgi:hypothetical protein